MNKKIIGTILLIAGLVLGVVLFANGRLIFPHVIGPATLTVIGVILLAIKNKASSLAE
jgi:hypothetical protein